MKAKTPLTDAVLRAAYLAGYDTVPEVQDHARCMERDRAELIAALEKIDDRLAALCPSLTKSNP